MREAITKTYDTLSERMCGIYDKILAPEIKIVSFDIFDTLILRPVLDPQDMFVLAGQIADVEFFPQKRITAEVQARKYYKNAQDEDVTLGLIYEVYANLFNIDPVETERLKRIELDLELELTYPRQITKLLYQAALDADKEVIIVSDMYLSAEFLARMLEKNGYTGYSKLYISSEYRLFKGTGNLWTAVICEFAKRGIKTNEIIHIGDNWKSDVTIPRSKGLQAEFIMKVMDCVNKHPRLKAITKYSHANIRATQFQMMMGLAFNFMFDDPYKPTPKYSRYNGEARQFGYLIAPWFITSALWLAEQAKIDKIDKLILAYRDGYMHKKILDILTPYFSSNTFSIETAYLSRILRTPFFASKRNGLFEAIIHDDVISTLTVDSFISDYLNITDDEAATKIRKIFYSYGCSRGDKIIVGIKQNPQLCAKVQEVWQPFALDYANQFRQYLSNICTDNCGIFDSGSRSASAVFVANYIGVNPVSYQLLGNPSTYFNKKVRQNTFVQYEYYMFSRASPAIILPEVIMSDPRAEVVGIKNGEPEILIQEETKFTHSIETIQGAVIEYVEQFAILFGKYIDKITYSQLSAYQIIYDLLLSPNRFDAEFIRNLYYPNRFDNHSETRFAIWYSSRFKSSATTLPFFERLRVNVWKLCVKLHILHPVRRVYRILSGKNVKFADSVRLKTEAAIAKLTSSPPVELPFVGMPHANFFKLLNAVAPNIDACAIVPQMSGFNKSAVLARIYVPDEFARSYTVSSAEKAIPSEIRAFFKQHPDLQECVDVLNVGYAGHYVGNSASVLVYYQYKYLREALRASKVLWSWNQFVPFNHTASIVAQEKNIPIVISESGMLPGTMLMDTFGMLGFGTIGKFPDRFAALPVCDEEIERARELISGWQSNNSNRYKQQSLPEVADKLTSIDRSRPTLLYAGELDAEAGMPKFWHEGKGGISPMFDSSDEAMRFLARLAEKNNWNLIYKPHPITVAASHSYLPKLHLPPKNVIYLPQGSLYDMFAVSDVIICIATSVSYNALVRGYPVVLLGKSTLIGQGCAYEALKIELIEPTIKTVLENKRATQQIAAFERHCAQLLKYYLFDDLQLRKKRYGLPYTDAVALIKMAENRKTSEDFVFGGERG
ncbi:MAG: hypothetical protein LBL96_11570 [Clostridiales bacterium]|nr:hypothetical protein [Clostridiales bacterium]